VTDAPHPADDDAAADEPVRQPERQLDLAAIERDLEGVEAALRRLEDGTYWADEVSGAPIPDDVLAADPVARRAP
jgi:RNA polymerase-binding transcription factor DksA